MPITKQNGGSFQVNSFDYGGGSRGARSEFAQLRRSRIRLIKIGCVGVGDARPGDFGVLPTASPLGDENGSSRSLDSRQRRTTYRPPASSIRCRGGSRAVIG